MFLLSVTESEIADRFQSLTVKQIPGDGSVLTIVTDGFLSHTVSTEKGVSIIESPLPPSDQSGDSDNLVLSRIEFNKQDKTIRIYKTTKSGSSIYYHINQKGEFYCSSHISLLRKAGVKVEDDESVLPEYFVYGYVMPPYTLYKNIEKVIAGSCINFQADNGKYSIASKSNFDIPEVNNDLRSMDTISRQISDLLTKSIQSLRPCSEKIAVLFSGGLDSSTLYTICKETYGINTTYSTGYPFEDPDTNREKEYAFSASKALGTSHNYFGVTTPDYLEGIVGAIDAAEEPLSYTQAAMFYLLFRDGIPKDKSIVISGLGAESGFGQVLHDGLYEISKMRWRLLSWGPLLRLIDLTYPITRRGRGYVQFIQRMKKARDYPISNPDSALWDLRAFASREWVVRYFNVTTKDIIGRRYDTLIPYEKRSLYEVIAISEFLSGAAALQLLWSKLAEKSGRIVHYPFTETDLLTYIYSVPWQVKLHKPKNVLRHVAYQKGVPRFIVDRPKRGFSIPPYLLENWVDILGPLIPLCTKVFDEREILNFRPSDYKEAFTFWYILNYSIWKRLHIDNEPVEGLLEELRFATNAS